VLAFLAAYLTSLTCGTPTAWVEIRGGTYTAQCGNEDGETVCHPSYDHPGCPDGTIEEQHASREAYNARKRVTTWVCVEGDATTCERTVIQ
jgi:hypothetical protein